jgi:hypothetical protein
MGIDPNDIQTGITVYPNPSDNGLFNLKVDYQIPTDLHISVMDIPRPPGVLPGR